MKAARSARHNQVSDTGTQGSRREWNEGFGVPAACRSSWAARSLSCHTKQIVCFRFDVRHGHASSAWVSQSTALAAVHVNDVWGNNTCRYSLLFFSCYYYYKMWPRKKWFALFELLQYRIPRNSSFVFPTSLFCARGDKLGCHGWCRVLLRLVLSRCSIVT